MTSLTTDEELLLCEVYESLGEEVLGFCEKLRADIARFKALSKQLNFESLGGKFDVSASHARGVLLRHGVEFVKPSLSVYTRPAGKTSARKKYKARKVKLYSYHNMLLSSAEVAQICGVQPDTIQSRLAPSTGLTIYDVIEGRARKPRKEKLHRSRYGMITTSQICERAGLTKVQVYARLHQGFTADRVIDTPINVACSKAGKKSREVMSET